MTFRFPQEAFTLVASYCCFFNDPGSSMVATCLQAAFIMQGFARTDKGLVRKQGSFLGKNGLYLRIAGSLREDYEPLAYPVDMLFTTLTLFFCRLPTIQSRGVWVAG